ncbi:MAG: hypothetical protein ACON4P_02825 [Candidatus Puniceispirillales bacterium]
MTGIVVLKFIHYLCLFVAGGIGVGGAVVQSMHIKAQTPPAPPVGKALRVLGLAGLAAIVVLWLTGIGLAHAIYGTLALGTAFTVKLVGAGVLLGASAAANLHLHRAIQAGSPPDARFMKSMMTVSRGGLVLVLGGIAVTTTL